MGLYWLRKISLPIKKIIADYESGMNLTQIGKKFGVSQGTIKRRLIEAGVYQHNRFIRRMIEATRVQKIEATRVQKIKDRERKKMLYKERNMMRFPICEVISEYQSGMSPVELAEKYGVSEATIRKRLKEAGVRKITAKERNTMRLPMAQIISDYQSGMTLKALGEKYGVNQNTIRTRLIEAGVQQERRGRKKIDLPMDQIWFDYESGMSTRQLGKKYGVSHRTIRTRLKEAECNPLFIGIKRNRKGEM